jgi:hypothetical protein
MPQLPLRAKDSRESSTNSAKQLQDPPPLVEQVDEMAENPDGTIELGGYVFKVDWDEIDPPDGHSDMEEVSHETVVADMCALLGLPAGSL